MTISYLLVTTGVVAGGAGCKVRDTVETYLTLEELSVAVNKLYRQSPEFDMLSIYAFKAQELKLNVVGVEVMEPEEIVPEVNIKMEMKLEKKKGKGKKGVLIETQLCNVPVKSKGEK